jgi:hypothetical protein
MYDRDARDLIEGIEVLPMSQTRLNVCALIGILMALCFNFLLAWAVNVTAVKREAAKHVPSNSRAK